ncbi:MAG: hypothetical protein IKH92_00575 [Clostridiales bacterium]|nr:hypothetical protein [Clostridiales bacterium]
MGFFDFLSSGDDTSYGYKTFKNTYGLDNEKMLQLLLKAEDTGYGTPKFGWIRAFGKERQVIVYNNANEINYVYVDAQPKKIIVSMAPKPGQIGGAKDHYNPEDSSAEDPNPVGSTIDSMEPVDEIIKLVKTVLEDPSL